MPGRVVIPWASVVFERSIRGSRRGEVSVGSVMVDTS